jgi:hypothetical protein
MVNVAVGKRSIIAISFMRQYAWRIEERLKMPFDHALGKFYKTGEATSALDEPLHRAKRPLQLLNKLERLLQRLNLRLLANVIIHPLKEHSKPERRNFRDGIALDKPSDAMLPWRRCQSWERPSVSWLLAVGVPQLFALSWATALGVILLAIDGWWCVLSLPAFGILLLSWMYRPYLPMRGGQ